MRCPKISRKIQLKTSMKLTFESLTKGCDKLLRMLEPCDGLRNLKKNGRKMAKIEAVLGVRKMVYRPTFA